MAKYHIHAEKLKPLVLEAGFNESQLNLILRMMSKCKDLRQVAHIESFFSCMIPDNYQLGKSDQTIESSYGSFHPTIVKEVLN